MGVVSKPLVVSKSCVSFVGVAILACFNSANTYNLSAVVLEASISTLFPPPLPAIVCFVINEAPSSVETNILPPPSLNVLLSVEETQTFPSTAISISLGQVRFPLGVVGNVNFVHVELPLVDLYKP